MKVFSKFHGTFASQEKKYYASLVGVLGTFGFSTKPNLTQKTEGSRMVLTEEQEALKGLSIGVTYAMILY